MYLKELEYILKLAEEGNLTRAASKLFITPSALTQQLMKLEEEIGTPLFIRSHGQWTITSAGEIYLSAAKEILKIKHDTYNQIHDLCHIQKGTLTIGFPPERGAALFSGIYSAFHKRYPNIRIQIKELSVKNQQKLIKEGALDLGFMTLTPTQQTEDHYIPVKDEEILLAVPKNIASVLVPDIQEDSPLSLNIFKEEPFAIIYRESTARPLMDKLMQQSGITTDIILESARFQTILEIVNKGLCCSLVGSYYQSKTYENVAFFQLPEHPSWQLCACYQKNTYLSEAARYIIELVKNS